MNTLLWILQSLLALHTVIGAIWKFSNSAQAIPSLEVIPQGGWMTLSIIEFLCALGLILPIVNKKLGKLAPIAAIIIASEMIIFSVLNLFSGNGNYSEIVYWIIVAVISAFIAYGRLILKPVK